MKTTIGYVLDLPATSTVQTNQFCVLESQQFSNMIVMLFFCRKYELCLIMSYVCVKDETAGESADCQQEINACAVRTTHAVEKGAGFPNFLKTKHRNCPLL
jgi:hypothetical protein